MKKTPRRILLGALGLVGLVALALVAAVIVVHTDWGRERVRERLEDRLADVFVGGATVGRLEGSPFGELALRDLVIHGPGGEPAITAKTVRIRLAILPLLSKQARLPSVIVEDAEVILDRDERGELEIKRLLRPGPRSGWSAELPDIRVHRAHVSYDTGRGERVNLDDVELEAEAHAPSGEPLRAAVQLTARWRERGLPLQLDASVKTGEGQTTIERAYARAGDVVVIGEDVRIVRSPGGRPAISGTISVDAPRAAVARLGLGWRPPADLRVRATATRRPGSPWTELELAGQVGSAAVTAQLRADLDARRFAGSLSTGTLDVTALSAGRVQGAASVSATFDGALHAGRELPVGRATIDARGTIEGVPEAAVRIALSSTGDHVSATASLTGRDLRANATAELDKRGEAITLARATLTATTGDPRRATGGAAPVRGALRAELTASGALAPRPSLAVAGTIDGRRLRLGDLSVASMKLAIDARGLPARPRGRAELLARGVVRGAMHLTELAVTARNRDDGKIAVALRTRPKQHPWLLEADALVTPGEVVAIDLVRHHVRAGSGTDWRGDSGRIAISPRRIELRDFATRSRGGALELAGVYHRAGRRAGDIEARVEATGLGLANLDRRYLGTVSGWAELQRRDGRLAGRAEVAGRGVALSPAAEPIDVEAKLDVRAGRLAVDARAIGRRLGRIALVADLDAPRDASNVRAWQALGRGAIRTGRLTLERVDVARLAALARRPGEHRGMLDGELRLSGTTASGAVTARGLVTPATQGLGPIDADLQLAQTPRGELESSVAMRLEGIGRLDARVAIAPPARPFDPRAWRRLGRAAIASAQVRTSELAFDPGVLGRLGITSNLRGRASISVELGAGARVAKVSGQIRELRGTPIAQPISVDLSAVAGAQATTFQLIACAGGVRLVEASGRIPRSLAQLQANPRAAPLTATAKLPDVPARRLLAVFGRGDVTGGSVAGTIEVAGTLGAPTGRARVTATGVTMPPGPLGRPTKTLERLALDARWDGRTGSIEISGRQPGGTLHVVAKGSPRALGRATLSLRARQFDLRPVLVFAPGAAGASGGVLDASLTVTSLDPRTARAAGELHVTEARVPIAPTIGTLRRAKIDVVAGPRDLRLALDGRLGGGTVRASGTIGLDGAAPTGGDFRLALRRVSPIGVVEPDIDADVTGTLTRGRDRWIADVVIRNGAVLVPKGRGERLKPIGPPDDMVFPGGAPPGRRPRKEAAPARPVIATAEPERAGRAISPARPARGGRALSDVAPAGAGRVSTGAAPERGPGVRAGAPARARGPVLVARIRIEPTYFEAEEARGILKGRLTATVGPDSLALVGVIDAERSNLELFGRRYLVERASARFDGPTDPILDVVITHDFPEVTTITTIRGRLSKPELIMSSDPGLYSQGQLLGFLLGGEPSGQPATGNPRDRVTAAGTSIVANRIGGYVKRALPFDLDVLSYEAATASSSAAFIVGTWLTRSLFVSYRHRLEARPDENTGEAEVEYWISRRVMVEGVVGDRGYSGADLLWRKRY